MKFLKRLFGIPAELVAINIKLGSLLVKLINIERTLGKMSQIQDKIDALVASENADLNAIATDLGAINDAVTAQKQAFEDFKNANPDADVSALEAAQANLDGATANLGNVASSINGIVTSSAAPTGGDGGGAGSGDGSGTPPAEGDEAAQS